MKTASAASLVSGALGCCWFFVAGCVVEDSRYSWIPDAEKRISATDKFTYDSKLHPYQRATADLHHSDIMYRDRPVLQIGSIATRNAEKLDRVRRASFGN